MISVVIGGQFGSCGKGAVAAQISHQYEVHVRVGAANAGHTIYTSYDVKPQKHVLQQLPCAAYANPNATLALGPGALISESILLAEIEQNRAWREDFNLPSMQLLIDRRAHIVQYKHVLMEQRTDLANRIGSTSTIAKEGIGTASAARVMRDRDTITVKQHRERLEAIPGVVVGDVVSYLHQEKDYKNILLEGTQGTGLSLTTGFYPYTTSRNTTASGLAADCGLGPGDIDHVIVVLRTFPIRVAGNSGPFYPDSQEIRFSDIGVEPEHTTITQLERRVATFSMWQAVDACRLNTAPKTEIALMFGDYLCPKIAGKEQMINDSSEGLRELQELIYSIQCQTGVKVKLIGTGPYSMIERYRDF